MKTFTVLILLSLFFLFFSCKKDSTTKNDETSLLNGFSVTDSASDMFLKFAAEVDGNPYKALSMTRDWILSMETVEDAIIIDSTFLKIKQKSGLITTFYYDRIDADGFSRFRGNGVGHSDKVFAFNNKHGCSNEIKNKNVLIFAAASKEFYGTSNYLENIAKIYTDTDPAFNVNILKDHQCTYEVLNTFGNYGLVIIDTHGASDAFMLGYKLILSPKPKTEEELRSLIKAQAGEDVLNMILDGSIGYSAASRIRSEELNWFLDPQIETENQLWVRTQYINSLGEWPGTVVFGNMCNSGCNKINNEDVEFSSFPLMREAFLNRNVISYYGYAMDNEYSNLVSDKLAKMMEDSLSRAFVLDGDSTGNAHLKANNAEFNDIFANKHLKLKHFGMMDFCFGRCGADLTDPRDGRIYKTVCIGDQVWMAENLNLNIAGSWCYDESPMNCERYGRLYDWETIMQGASATHENPSGVRGICPEGWHVPSFPEWIQLLKFVGIETAGGSLKDTVLWNEPNSGATNSSGFSAIPGGHRDTIGNFMQLGNYAQFWTSSDSAVINKKRFFVMSYNNAIAGPSVISENYGFALRCVKD